MGRGGWEKGRGPKQHVLRLHAAKVAGAEPAGLVKHELVDGHTEVSRSCVACQHPDDDVGDAQLWLVTQLLNA